VDANNLILKNLNNEKAIFVFPSESAASAYADWALKEKAAGALRLDRFIAWDVFKSRAIKAARGAGLKSAPPALRKLFAAALLEENKQRGAAGEKPVLRALIPAKYAGYSPSFASWIADILPQLSLWAEAAAPSEGAGTPLQMDLFALFSRYRLFLEAHGFFEGAWERPPFSGEGKHYFIFYPEALADFADYEKLLAAADSVTLIPAPRVRGKPEVFFYKSAQTEITAAALYILNLHNTGCPYEDIIVSVPDMDDYAPFIKKEFTARNIPLVDRNGKKLSAYQAGRLFSCMQNCYTSGFSFASVVSLLSNNALPWKEKNQIAALIDFGLENSCVCSWKEEDGSDIDIWKASHFNSESTAVFYADLSAAIRRICGAKIFSDIKKYYFAFRSRFLNMEEIAGSEADSVISRCITELENIDALCTSIPELAVKNPFGFFARHISETIYMPQAREGGALLLPYRIAAAMPSAYHIVLGANQNGMAQTNSRLDFLPRAALPPSMQTEENAGEVFYNLHIEQAQKKAVFFCSEEAFSGFTIPFSLLDAGEAQTGILNEAPFSPDLFHIERGFLADGGGAAAFGASIHSVQKNGFEQFALRNSPPKDSAASRETSVRRFSVSECALRRFSGGMSDKFNVSASALRPFFQCSLLWLFESVLRIQGRDGEAHIFDPAIWGSLYHVILKTFFNDIKKNNMILDVQDDNTLPPEYIQKLDTAVDYVFNNLDTIIYTSTIKRILMHAQKDAAQKKLLRLAGNLFAKFEGAKVLLTEENLMPAISASILNFDTQGIKPEWNGKPDLVLEMPDGEIVIVDFKSGNLPEKSDCFANKDGILRDFQMPLYRVIVDVALGKKAQTGVFAGVKEANVEVYFSPGKKNKQTPADFDSVEPLLYTQAADYIRCVLKGEIQTYINKHYTMCAGCLYKNICRRTFTTQRGNLWL
jgi:hypothetical protein